MKASAKKIVSETFAATHGEVTPSRWTHKAVKVAIVDAFRVLHATTGPVGPKTLRAYWPEYSQEWSDLLAAVEIGYRPAKARVRRRPTPIEIASMEIIVFGWTDKNGVFHRPWQQSCLKGYPELNDALTLWVLAELYGRPIGKVCKSAKIPRRTFNRRVSVAAGMIADWLNKRGVEVW